jgi:hypothetical protein
MTPDTIYNYKLIRVQVLARLIERSATAHSTPHRILEDAFLY